MQRKAQLVRDALRADGVERRGNLYRDYASSVGRGSARLKPYWVGNLPRNGHPWAAK